MHLRIFKITAGLIITGLLFVCADRAVDPYGNNTKDESQFKGTVSGMVQNDAGQTVVGASVTLTPGGFSSNTDSLGRYTIPNVSANTYVIAFHHPSHFDTTLSRTILLVQDQDVININMTMQRDPVAFPGSIAGRIIKNGNTGIQGITITVDSAGLSTVSDSLGNFVITGVIAGIHSLIITKPGIYFDTTVENIAVSMSQQVSGIAITPRQNPVAFPGSISGHLADKNGKPIGVVTVTIDSAGLSTLTDSLGNFTIAGVIPGTHYLTFTKNNVYFDTTVRNITVAMEQKVSGIAMVLRQNPEYFPGSISGRTTNSSGQAIKGISVTVDSAGLSTVTDSLGKFTITGIATGLHRLTFERTGEYLDTTLSNIVVEMDQQTSGIVMMMQVDPDAFPGSIAGHVYATDFSIVKSATITVLPLGATTTSDSSGAYLLSDVKAGTYSLKFSEPSSYFDTIVPNITVNHSQAVTGANGYLRKNTGSFRGSISGTVTDSANRPLSGVSVAVDSAASITTDTSGNYLVPNVIAGSHTITFTKTGYSDTVMSGIVLALSQNLTGINMKMQMRFDAFPGSVSGHVYATDSTVIAGATITVLGNGANGTSGPDGSYTVTGVTAGTYTVQFHHSSCYDTTIPAIAVHHSEAVTGITGYLRKNPAFFRGGVRGIVVDSATHAPVGGVQITVAPGGYTGSSDVTGNYVIPNIPFGTYAVAASGNYRSGTRTGIVVRYNDTTAVDTLYAVNQLVLPKDVGGSITGNTSLVNRVVVTIKGDLIDSTNPILQQLTWLPISKQYTGSVYVPSAGIQWTAEVRVYDSANRVTGYQKMPFDKGAATVGMPSFDAENAKPLAIARPDTTLSINDTLVLRGAAVDTFDVKGLRANPLVPNIIQWEWAVGKTGNFLATGHDTTIILPQVQDTNYRCVLRVTDDDTTTRTDTIRIRVLRDMPAPKAGNDTIVSIYDIVRLHGTATQQFGQIIKWEWDIGATGVFHAGSGDTAFAAPAKANSDLRCVLRVTDDDNNLTTDTMKTNVVQDVPVPKAGDDTTVSIYDTVRLHATATQSFGSVAKWEWDAGATGTFRVSKADTIIRAPKSADANYRCIVRVTDDDGNTALDTTTVNVVQDIPVPDAGADTAWLMGSIDSLHGRATQSFGSIVKWEWAIDAGAFNPTRTGDTAIVLPPVYISNYPVRLRVTDDDGNVAIDTMNIAVGYQWATAGVAGFSTGSAVKSIHLAPFKSLQDSAFYVSYIDNLSGFTRPRVAQWNGASWSIMASDSLTTNITADFSSFSLGHGYGGMGGTVEYNIPYLAFPNTAYASTRDSIQIRYTTVFTKLGSSIFVGNNPLDFTTTKTLGGPLYIGWIDGSSKVVVFKGTTSWTLAGDTVSKGESAKNLEMAISGTGIPYISYSTNWTAGANHPVYVKRLSGTTWSTIGTFTAGDNGLSGILPDHDQAPLAMNNDTVYISYVDAANSNKVTVMKYNGSQWTLVGSAGFSDGQAMDLSIAINNSTIYVAYLERNQSNRITVKTFNGTGWVTVGPQGFSATNQNHLALSFYQNIPYVAACDGANGNKLSVYKLR